MLSSRRTARSRAAGTPVRHRVRNFFYWLVRLRGSPHAIAGGLAVGMFITFTPTVGLQTLIALAIATAANLSRAAAVLPVWLTNPVTAPPVFAFTYWTGTFFWPGPEAAVVASAMRDFAEGIDRVELGALPDHLEVFGQLGLDVFVPLWIGGTLVGLAAAAVVYPVTYRMVLAVRRGRVQRVRQRRPLAGPAPLAQRRPPSSTP